MRVLLAGGAGFIGSHIADALLARGDEVVAIDNFATGRRENVAHLSGNAKFSLIEHDITLPWPTHPALEAKFDAVLDYASPASPNDFATMPLEILAVGSTGTRNLLDRAKADGAVFFLTSTSEVYGDPLVHPQPETYWGNVSSIGPRSCYDEAKRFSEALTMAYHRVHGVDVRIVRIFNTYGERMRPNDGRVVNTFVVQALRGQPLTLHGDGSQTRSFCHVNDEVGGLMALLDSDYNLPVNVGNPGEFTMRELAELVVELTGSKSEIITVELPPEREGDPLQRKPDITVAKNLLGWEPTISLREGLKRMIKHFVDVEGIS
ncbi:MAG: NAD-dependent epimerase/dehydratase family protein [Actinobacteria bacterium]|uniref:UDP-glucuronate decarboxylase n=1 Tax=freshwater metagenome TaxID=449393 RepID=A0A6J6Q8F7_9ZZZZ|nr:NAD-dependent epimerase/dehydratase family protein [Actinomycetota bacterium]MSX14818.1 NAD-dependent epimerase/dehydratase family protein [Actinomycetota bacterium]MUH55460.1 NAD-dependent epimerase/dehydratase family protein [Actinomycetota bacterium]